VQLAAAQALAHYWLDEYDFGRVEARLNELPQFVTRIDGVEASYPNVVYFNEVDKGGHFAAWEEPEVFSEEMRAAFRSVR